MSVGIDALGDVEEGIAESAVQVLERVIESGLHPGVELGLQARLLEGREIGDEVAGARDGFEAVLHRDLVEQLVGQRVFAGVEGGSAHEAPV